MKSKARKVSFDLILCLGAMLTLLLVMSTTAMAASNVRYIDAEGKQQTAASAKSIESNTTDWQAGWYVVDKDVTVNDRINVTGEANLILTDGKKLNANAGITTHFGKLNIYGQVNGSGELTARTSEYLAGIGGGYDEYTPEIELGGDLTINGGRINAYGGDEAPGIGGGFGDDGGRIVINRGIVYAEGGSGAAGIGGGYGADGGNIVINGGAVTAKAGSGAGCAIGHGNDYDDDWCSIDIKSELAIMVGENEGALDPVSSNVFRFDHEYSFVKITQGGDGRAVVDDVQDIVDLVNILPASYESSVRYARAVSYTRGLYDSLEDSRKSDPRLTEEILSKLESWETGFAESRSAKLKSVKALKGKKASLKWNEVSGADGYQLVYSTSKKFTKKTTKKVTISKASTISKTVKKLKKGKKYYFRIRSFNKTVNGTKVYGKWSSKKSMNAK